MSFYLVKTSVGSVYGPYSQDQVDAFLSTSGGPATIITISINDEQLASITEDTELTVD